jgi:uncharacterized damage-inducible protein DinB
MMVATNNNLTVFYQGWPEHRRLLVEMIAPLTPEQLALGDSTGQRPVWPLTAHIIGARIGWFRRRGEAADPAITPIDRWDADGAAPRSAAELIHGLEHTWALVADGLDRWTPAMLDDAFTYRRSTNAVATRTRGWIIWHVLEHDIHHGGEISLTLGSPGLTALDL